MSSPSRTEAEIWSGVMSCQPPPDRSSCQDKLGRCAPPPNSYRVVFGAEKKLKVQSMASHNQKNTIVSVLRIHRRQQHPSALADEPVGRLVEAVQRASSWSRVIIAVSTRFYYTVRVSLSSEHSMMPPTPSSAKPFPLDQN